MAESTMPGGSGRNPPANETRPLTPADVDRAAEVVVRSFFNDPGMAWVLPDDDVRRRLGAAIATAFIRYGCIDGLVEVDAAGGGMAMWFPPEIEAPQEPVLRLTGMWGVPEMIGDVAWARIRGLMSDLAGLDRTRAAEPHWYLCLLGVDPDVQRRGVGTALLRSQLARIDAAGLPCYLITPTADNVRFYEGRGFRVVAGADAAGGDLHFRLMRRPANGG